MDGRRQGDFEGEKETPPVVRGSGHRGLDVRPLSGTRGFSRVREGYACVVAGEQGPQEKGTAS